MLHIFIVTLSILFCLIGPSFANEELAEIQEAQTQEDSNEAIESADATEEEVVEEEQPEIAYTHDLSHENIPNLLKRSQILIEERKNGEADSLLILILNYTKEHQLTKYQIDSLIKLGNLKYNLGDEIAATTYYQEAITLIEGSTDKSLLGSVYAKLAYLYYKTDLALAKTYLELALNENEEKKQTNLMAENYYNLAVIYKKLGFLDKSKQAKQNYKEIAKKVKNKNFYKLSEQEETTEFKYDIASPADKNYSKAEYANIQILNKIDGFTYLFETKIGSKMEFRTIEIITRSCLKAPPEDLPENMLLLEVKDKNNTKTPEIFNGWMFSSSPSLNSLEHPVYDIRVLNCELKHI